MSNEKKKTKKKKVLLAHKLLFKKISEYIGEGKTIEEATGLAMKDLNYSDSYIRSGHLKDTQSWDDLMETLLPDTLLTKVHVEGLQAGRTVYKNNNETGEIENMGYQPDYPTRHKYLDTAYKIKKKYDNTITLKGKLAGLSDGEIEDRIAGILSGVIGAFAGKGKAVKK